MQAVDAVWELQVQLRTKFFAGLATIGNLRYRDIAVTYAALWANTAAST